MGVEIGQKLETQGLGSTSRRIRAPRSGDGEQWQLGAGPSSERERGRRALACDAACSLQCATWRSGCLSSLPAYITPFCILGISHRQRWLITLSLSVALASRIPGRLRFASSHRGFVHPYSVAFPRIPRASHIFTMASSPVLNVSVHRRNASLSSRLAFRQAGVVAQLGMCPNRAPAHPTRSRVFVASRRRML